MLQLTGVARRLTKMHLLSLCLAALWAAVAIAILVAYQPGGPFDLLVRVAIFGPLPIALAAIRWPPDGGTWRANAAIAWLGLIAGLLLMPLLGGVLETLRGSGRQALFPSAEVAYAGLLALGLTSLYAAIGVVRAHAVRPGFSRTTLIEAVSLAVALTALASATLGLPSLANELALRDRPQVSSRFGPTDTTLQLAPCGQPVLLGGTAVLGGDAKATIDGVDVADVVLTGSRSGTQMESWTADRTGRFGSGRASYRRNGASAAVTDARGDRSLAPQRLGLLDARGLTVDGPIGALVSTSDLSRVVEDRGIELIEDARSRHCRIAIDGPSALSGSVLVRLIVDGTLDVRRPLDAWRGTLDWWVFADDQVGQAVITIGGYPGDAWSTAGLQASIVARMTATDRSGSAIMPTVTSSHLP